MNFQQYLSLLSYTRRLFNLKIAFSQNCQKWSYLVLATNPSILIIFFLILRRYLWIWNLQYSEKRCCTIRICQNPNLTKVPLFWPKCLYYPSLNAYRCVWRHWMSVCINYFDDCIFHAEVWYFSSLEGMGHSQHTINL